MEDAGGAERAQREHHCLDCREQLRYATKACIDSERNDLVMADVVGVPGAASSFGAALRSSR